MISLETVGSANIPSSPKLSRSLTEDPHLPLHPNQQQQIPQPAPRHLAPPPHQDPLLSLHQNQSVKLTTSTTQLHSAQSTGGVSEVSPTCSTVITVWCGTLSLPYVTMWRLLISLIAPCQRNSLLHTNKLL